MACFSAPLAVGIITTIFRKKIPEKYHIKWLNILLLGGSVGLALEHIAHQEIVLYPPFLTAMSSPADTALMFQEIMTVGIAMLLVCIGIWVAMVLVASTMITTTKVTAKHTA